MTCSHDRYREYPYMQENAAMRAMKAGSVCYIGGTVEACEDCGEPLSQYKIKRVATAVDYMKIM